MNKKQQKILELQSKLNRYPCVPGRINCCNCGKTMLVYPYPAMAGTGVCECSTPKWGIEFIEFYAEPIMKETRKMLENTISELLEGQQKLSFINKNGGDKI